MLKVEKIRFGYVPSVDIFRNVTFTIEGGEYIAIGGRNGCGKTTITRLLVGLEKAREGHMYYNGRDITSMPPSKRGQFIGYVFQQPDRQMFRPTVATEVAFGPESLGRSKAEVKRIVDEVLERTGIGHLREAYPPTLRRGEKQRVAIAGIIAMRPDCIVMDEPTVGVDAQSREHIMSSIKKLRESGATVIYTSHYMHEVEEICDRVAIIDKGRLVAEGTQQELITMITDSCTVHITTKQCDSETRSRVSRAVSCLPDVNRVQFSDNMISVDMSISCNDISHVISELVKQNLPVIEISTEKPDMDAVFLSLTGHEIR